MNKRFFAGLVVFLAACTPSPEPQTQGNEQESQAPDKAPDKAKDTAPLAKETPVASAPKEIAADAPLEEGHVAFEGIVVGTKGGYIVRGVVVEDDDLQKALAGAPEADPKNPDWFLGAVVRIEGELKKHEAPPPSKGDEVEQMRSGTWFGASRIDAVKLIKPADVIEGVIHRSKGFFSVEGRLITHEDYTWSLASRGVKDGERVRLYGQKRTVVCAPNTQCLIQGSLPLFDVGRAERAP